jgi:hypothetical protein
MCADIQVLVIKGHWLARDNTYDKARDKDIEQRFPLLIHGRGGWWALQDLNL